MVFVRSLSSSSLPVNIPWSLTEIERGTLNANKLVRHIICAIIEIKPLKNNVYHKVPKMLKSLANLPPQYFKMCSYLSGGKPIQLEMTDWPVTIMADGCSTNVSAGNKISECFGLMSPNLRCWIIADKFKHNERARNHIISGII